MKRAFGLRSGVAAFLLSAGCASVAPDVVEAGRTGAPWLSKEMARSGQFVLPGALALPLWPGHSIASGCAADPARSACVVIGGARETVDARTTRAAYMVVLEAQGWARQWPDGDGPVLLRATSGAPRCLQISFGVWDNGKSSRVRLKPVLRFELDPWMVDCENPGEGPPMLPVQFPGDRG